MKTLAKLAKSLQSYSKVPTPMNQSSVFETELAAVNERYRESLEEVKIKDDAKKVLATKS
ncbi:hypothetical protein [Candidatus Nanohalobium constans]|uniref:Uncharacterized protein n=1 Tax=Candidatus Nanohalobium constans TaxID=2565781 RepID=A0A5Q0UFC7_9ARCH|nr:hypothetical protein [Candidatus Nanohalobium constans]QGA80214.1 hypothetical protein LC1Nh_0311 [Candidatus Nanohalobium constans]